MKYVYNIKVEVFVPLDSHRSKQLENFYEDIYRSFHANSTRLKPSFFFLIEAYYRWPTKKPTPIFIFF